jgi:hypothetical protein
MNWELFNEPSSASDFKGRGLSLDLIIGIPGDRLEKAGSFPKRFSISSRKVAWREDDIAEWADSRLAKADGC